MGRGAQRQAGSCQTRELLGDGLEAEEDTGGFFFLIFSYTNK